VEIKPDDFYYIYERVLICIPYRYVNISKSLASGAREGLEYLLTVLLLAKSRSLGC